MRRYLHLALASLIAAPWTGAAVVRAHPPAIVNQATEKAMGEEIADFRARMARAIQARDQARLRRMYAESHRHTDEAGTLHDKAQRIAAALTGAPMIETAVVEELRISVTNGWVAIVTGRSSLRTAEGAAYAVRWTAVYVRAGDDWQLAASQATRVP